MRMYKYTMQIRKSEAHRCCAFWDKHEINKTRILFFEGKNDDLYLYLKATEDGMFDINNHMYTYSEIIDIYASVFYEHKMNVLCGYGNCIPEVTDRKNRIQFAPVFESYYDIKVFFCDNGTVTVLTRDVKYEFGKGNFKYCGEVEYNDETNEITPIDYIPDKICLQ